MSLSRSPAAHPCLRLSSPPWAGSGAVFIWYLLGMYGEAGSHKLHSEEAVP